MATLSNADLFLAGKAVIKMLKTPSQVMIVKSGFYFIKKTFSLQVWVGEYSHTESTGGTFPMTLTGMSAKYWREALDFSRRKVKSIFKGNVGPLEIHHHAQEGGPRGMEKLVGHFKELNGETN